MNCSACGKEARAGVVVCDSGPCLFPRKVRRFLSSDAACGLGPDAVIQPSAIYALGACGLAGISVLALLLLV